VSTAAPSSGYESRLRSRHQVAERTLAFHFDRPAGWVFKPGQSLDLTLLNPPLTDDQGNTRAFSIASSPNEDTLMIATRMRDTAFKRVLGAMPFGTAVTLEGPFGNMTLHNNTVKTAVILTGGIGVTPFRSMALHAARQKLAHKILLFYSNRRPEDAAFLEELQNLQTHNPNYRLIATMTHMDKSQRSWSGEIGYINGEMLSRHKAAMNTPVYYVAGPPGMVSGLRSVLNQMGVDDDDIRSEDFAGYQRGR
jgi:ferredoxin-NADP reductase